MSLPFSIKETVKVLNVTKPLQKINFQIRHPENVIALIGIAVTSNLVPLPLRPGDVDKGNTAGNLSLAISQKGDVAFGEDVKIDNNDYADLPEKMVYGWAASIESAKKRQFYFETFYKVDKALLEGFYEDIYSPPFQTDDKGIPYPKLYKVSIYLRYKVFEK